MTDPQPNETIRVRPKQGSNLIIGREAMSGRPIKAAPGEWIELPAKELRNPAIARQVETEEQAQEAEEKAAELADHPRGEPREDPEFMRIRNAARRQVDSTVTETEAVRKAEAEAVQKDEQTKPGRRARKGE